MSESELQVQYTSQSMLYTTQFIASMSGEEVVLDCGSAVVAGSIGSGPQLPIHTRMALPWSAVRRLYHLLGEMIASQESASLGQPGQQLATMPQSQIDHDAARPSRAALPPLSQPGTPDASIENTPLT